MTTCPIFLTINDESVTAVLEIIGLRKRKRVKARHCQTSFSRETTLATYIILLYFILFQVPHCDVFENRHVKRPVAFTVSPKS